jgi:hypothetical protein
LLGAVLVLALKILHPWKLLLSWHTEMVSTLAPYVSFIRKGENTTDQGS